MNRCVDTKSYTSLHALVNGMFPPMSSGEQVSFFPIEFRRCMIPSQIGVSLIASRWLFLFHPQHLIILSSPNSAFFSLLSAIGYRKISIHGISGNCHLLSLMFKAVFCKLILKSWRQTGFEQICSVIIEVTVISQILFLLATISEKYDIYLKQMQ